MRAKAIKAVSGHWGEQTVSLWLFEQEQFTVGLSAVQVLWWTEIGTPGAQDPQLEAGVMGLDVASRYLKAPSCF